MENRSIVLSNTESKVSYQGISLKDLTRLNLKTIASIGVRKNASKDTILMRKM